MKKQLLIVACGLALCLSAGVTQAQISVRIGPPPVRVERRPPLPPEHRDWVWRAGYHRWDGQRYVWVPGEYVAPPRPHAVWIPGRWVRRGGGYVWIEGRWR